MGPVRREKPDWVCEFSKPEEEQPDLEPVTLADSGQLGGTNWARGSPFVSPGLQVPRQDPGHTTGQHSRLATCETRKFLMPVA